jgi:hypothetical protein
MSKVGKNPQQVSPQEVAAAAKRARENEDRQPVPPDVLGEHTRVKGPIAEHPTRNPGQ